MKAGGSGILTLEYCLLKEDTALLTQILFSGKSVLASTGPILLLLLFLAVMLHWLCVLGVCVQVIFSITFCKYVWFI